MLNIFGKLTMLQTKEKFDKLGTILLNRYLVSVVATSFAVVCNERVGRKGQGWPSSYPHEPLWPGSLARSHPWPVKNSGKLGCYPPSETEDETKKNCYFWNLHDFLFLLTTNDF